MHYEAICRQNEGGVFSYEAETDFHMQWTSMSVFKGMEYWNKFYVAS
jgi:hypothetical protein